MAKVKVKPSENRGRELAVSNDPIQARVILKFDAPVTFMAFDPDGARALAKDLVENAKQAERRRTH